MLSRLCSTNSTKAVAFLYGDQLLCAGVGSELRVYSCSSSSSEVVQDGTAASLDPEKARAKATDAEENAEAHDKQTQSSAADGLPCTSCLHRPAKNRPFDFSWGLVASARFSSATHILGLSTSSGYIAAYGLGHLVLYQLQWIEDFPRTPAKPRRDRQTHASDSAYGVDVSPNETAHASRSSETQFHNRVEATVERSASQSPRAGARLSRLLRYSSRQWILDVRFLSTSGSREATERGGTVEERPSPPCWPFLLVGFALGRVDLLDSATGTRLASWTCTDRSLLYSLAVHIPRSSWSSKSEAVDWLHCTAPENKSALAGEAAHGIRRDARENNFPAQSTASITVASGTVYSSILLWNLGVRQSAENSGIETAGGAQHGGKVSILMPLSDVGQSRAGCTAGGEPLVRCDRSTDAVVPGPSEKGQLPSEMNFSLSAHGSSRDMVPPNTAVAPTQVLKGHRGVIFKVRFYLEGLLLCSASDDREVRLWWKSSGRPQEAGRIERETREEEREDRGDERRKESEGNSRGEPARESPSGLERSQRAAPFSDDLCSSEQARGPEAEYACVAILEGHRSRVWDIALLDISSDRSSSWGPGWPVPQGNCGEGVRFSSGMLFEEAQQRYLIVSAGEDSSCRIWSLRGEFLYSLLGHAGRGVRAVCAPEPDSISGRLPVIASGGEDGDVKLWSLGDSPTFVEILESRFKRLGAQAACAGLNSPENGNARETGPIQQHGRSTCQPGGVRRATVWNCRDHSGPDDFVREVRLLDGDLAVVATNFGCVYFLSLNAARRGCFSQKESDSSLGSSSLHGDSAQANKASLVSEEAANDEVASVLLAKVPAVLTCLRVLDGLTTVGCADGTFFAFFLSPEKLAVARESRDTGRTSEETRTTEPALDPPRRWACFQRARVGNLFQVALPVSQSEVLALARHGPLGSLHAAARSSFSTRSYWSEVGDRGDLSPKIREFGVDLRSTAPSSTGVSASAACCEAAARASNAADVSVEPGDSVDPPSPVENIVVATDHTGAVSLWSVSSGCAKKVRHASAHSGRTRCGPNGSVQSPESPEMNDSDFPAPSDRTDRALQRAHEDTATVSDPLDGLRTEPAVQWFASAQLTHAGGSKADASRCFSCLGLLCTTDAPRGTREASGSGSDGGAREDPLGGRSLSVLIVLGDEVGSLHVVQAVVPERQPRIDGAPQPEARQSEKTIERKRVAWAWSAARSRLAHTVHAAHKGKKVWDVAAHGNFLISCGGDGTILFLQVTRHSDGPKLPRGHLSRLGQDGDLGQRISEDSQAFFPFSVSISPVSCVKFPHLTLMHSLVPTETAPPWWSEGDTYHGEAAAGSSGGDAGPLRHNWLCAFRTADFVLFDLRTSMELMRVRCGNSRRPLDFHRENSHRYTFTSATKHLLYFHLHGRADYPASAEKVANVDLVEATPEGEGRNPVTCTAGERDRISGEKNGGGQDHGDTPARGLHDGSAVADDVSQDAPPGSPLQEEARRSASFNPGFHGREVWSVCWLDEETLATGGEDNSVKLISVAEDSSRQPTQADPRGLAYQLGQRATANSRTADGAAVPEKTRGRSPERTSKKQFTSGRPLSLLRPHPLCMSSASPSKWLLQVLQTGVHHTAAVRCVRLLDCLRPENCLASQAAPRVLVSVGACNTVSLFFVDPPAPRTGEADGVSAVSPKKNPLRMSHALSVRLSKRGQGTEVRLNGADGFIKRRCLPKQAEGSNAEETQSSDCRDASESLTVHIWTAASSAEVSYLEGTLELARFKKSNHLANRDRGRNSRLDKRASCSLEGAALCIRVVRLDVHANDVRGCSCARPKAEFDTGRHSSTETQKVLILTGMTTGDIAVFMGDANVARPRLERLGTLKGHQCGVNDLEVAEIQAASEAKAASDESAVSHAALCASSLAEPQNESHRYCIASCGDDQSVTVQFICVEHTGRNVSPYYLRVLSAFRVENAHSSSARSCALFFPLLFTVGWDRWVQVWMIRQGVVPGGRDVRKTSASRLLDRAEIIEPPWATRKQSLTAQRLNARSGECQQRQYWGAPTAIGEAQHEFSLERVDAIKTSVADAAHLDGWASACGVRVCVVGSSGGIECFQFRE
ncbi:putative WD-repeat proein [Neospora caninum Liverpool]|uniref:Putative WD-repeat proein n=1 Tax=Neospora caninum (strain Liverpool) TaxID=572307 RepID=F0VMS8_NEOCL|nr:putative WD-repeat proein [Neospora caninum Liverpool]CBZ55024.1 putative WD-repeat proein [Neospora caninum Liverpool]CEL69749.1 TPA: WD-repeat proein, putative [Neospora caninum Liverpool]|eukprot:XP_003885052.1 putative WD-repeat proein [Neospora caninum Liverpool]